MSDKEAKGEWERLVAHEKLGEILFKQKLLDLPTLAESMETQAKSGKRLGEILVETGTLTPKQIEDAINRQKKIDKVIQDSLDELGVDI